MRTLPECLPKSKGNRLRLVLERRGLRLQNVVEGVYEASDAFPGITRSLSRLLPYAWVVDRRLLLSLEGQERPFIRSGSMEQEWISTTSLSLFKKDQTCDQGQAIVFAINSSRKESGISSPLRRLPRELASNNLPFVWFL